MNKGKYAFKPQTYLETISRLTQGRLYRSKNPALDKSSRLELVPNDTWLNTHAKFAKATKGILCNDLVVYAGSRDPGAKGVYGIIETLCPKLVICIDIRTMKATAHKENTKVEYIHSDWNDVREDFYGRECLIISDLSVGDETDQVDVAATNKMNREILKSHGKVLVKWFLREVNNPVMHYKHLGHNLEYFSTGGSLDKAEQ